MISRLRVRLPLEHFSSRSIRVAGVGLATVLMASSAVAQTAPATNASGETPAEEYARILQQISDTRTNIARQEMLLERQQARIADLEARIVAVPEVAATIPPMLQKFTAGLEGAINEDVPFQLGERFERLNRMREVIGSPDARLAEKMSRALQVAGIEANYGYEIASYEGDHPLDPRRRYNACEADIESDECAITEDLERDLEAGASLPELDLQILDGDFVRYGRLSLAYVDKGTDDILVYDSTLPANERWREARGSERTGIRRNIRIARGEAAPDVFEAPVVKSN